MPPDYDIKSIHDRSVWRHEYGHYLDRLIGKDINYGSYISTRNDFSYLIKAETDELLKISGFDGSSENALEILEKRAEMRKLTETISTLSKEERSNYIEQTAQELGFSRKLIDDFMEEETIHDPNSGVDADLRKLVMLHGLKKRDANVFFAGINDGLLYSESYKMYKKGQTGHFSDLIGSASKNKLLGHGPSGFGGHDDDYLKDFGAPETEVFANLTSLLGNGEFWIKTVEMFYPALTKKYRQILDEVQNDG